MHSFCLWLCTLFDRADFDVFVRFENTASSVEVRKMLDDMMGLGNYVFFFCLHDRAVIGTYYAICFVVRG